MNKRLNATRKFCRALIERIRKCVFRLRMYKLSLSFKPITDREDMSFTVCVQKNVENLTRCEPLEDKRKTISLRNFSSETASKNTFFGFLQFERATVMRQNPNSTVTKNLTISIHSSKYLHLGYWFRYKTRSSRIIRSRISEPCCNFYHREAIIDFPYNRIRRYIFAYYSGYFQLLWCVFCSYCDTIRRVESFLSIAGSVFIIDSVLTIFVMATTPILWVWQGYVLSGVHNSA